MKFLIFALLPALTLALGHMVGGKTETHTPNPKVVNFAIDAINQHFNVRGHQLQKQAEVIHAETQVVAGENLYLVIELKDLVEKCDFMVQFQAWMDPVFTLVNSTYFKSIY